ncbi:MAG: glycoside hydrolase family 16 protein, partial [candidate division KSB1 bacterium]|nr:glycoside hydrolase family 16 protein [candidate division KSB1 bacterium]
MRKTTFLLLMLTIVSFAGEPKLIWSEEFDYTGLPDSTKWTYETGFIRNRELQFYTLRRAENARVENGMLIIETRHDNYQNSPITSASLTTEGKAAWKYVRVEVRAKIPTGLGMWPAIWMLGVNYRSVGWPACGEIDIMENVGYDPEVIHANVHTKAYNHMRGNNKGDRITIKAPWEDFHIYALEWRRDRLDFFVDNVKYFTYENEGTGADAWPFDQPHYLILNSAFGGSWGGSKGLDPRVLPQKFYIDYVRVYQLE